MPSLKVIQLRQALAEKFPGMRMRLEAKPARESGPEPDLFQNCLVKGALNELSAGRESTGSATMMRALIAHAAARNQIMAAVDGFDSLDVSALEPAELARLLWIRCRDAETALKAADLLLRDGNLPLIFLDLKLNPEAQLRKIPATTWYRFQRLVETTSAICLAITPRPMIPAARARFVLKTSFALRDLERDAPELVDAASWEADALGQRNANLHSA
ncbi:MAG TPA: hypothetical protein VGO59_02495 [Verrucomicrobiae bacterium]|jgi:hypothetical protein